MDVTDLRIALFSGNYNMTLDGANKALNRLAEYLMRRGAALRVYSPTIDKPAFEPQGDLVSLPSVPIPGRSEYRVPLGLDAATREDLAAFAPNLVHIASPDFSARAAVKWARGRDIPVLASVHTRFETYPRYYRMGFLEPVVEAYLRGIYRKCDALVTPSQSMVDTLHEQRMHDDVTIWSRGRCLGPAAAVSFGMGSSGTHPAFHLRRANHTRMCACRLPRCWLPVRSK